MAQDLITPPPTRGTVDEENADGKLVRVARPWASWFLAVFQACFAIYQAGATAQRPTENLWIGRPYFDTTLGYAIWYDGTNWVDAQGNTV